MDAPARQIPEGREAQARTYVRTLYMKGRTVGYIQEKTGWDRKFILDACRHVNVQESTEITRKQIAREIFKTKVPTLKEIVGIGLQLITECLSEIKEDPDKRKEFLKSPKDVKAISDLVTDINGLLRLELGQSTQNIEQHTASYQETRVVLAELAKKDPVFEYPVLRGDNGAK